MSLIPIGRRQVSYAEFAGPVAAVDEPVDIGICEIDEVDDRFEDTRTILCGEGPVDTAPEEAGSRSGTRSSRPARDCVGTHRMWVWHWGRD